MKYLAAATAPSSSTFSISSGSTSSSDLSLGSVVLGEGSGEGSAVSPSVGSGDGVGEGELAVVVGAGSGDAAGEHAPSVMRTARAAVAPANRARTDGRLPGRTAPCCACAMTGNLPSGGPIRTVASESVDRLSLPLPTAEQRETQRRDPRARRRPSAPATPRRTRKSRSRPALR